MIARNKNNNILTCHSSQQEEQTTICFSNQTLLHYLTSCSPSPHSRWCASPHGWWRGHPARGGQPARGRTHGGSQHSCDRDLLTVDLTWMGGGKKEDAENQECHEHAHQRAVCRPLVQSTLHHTITQNITGGHSFSTFMFLHVLLPPSMCFRAFSASSGVSNST